MIRALLLIACILGLVSLQWKREKVVMDLNVQNYDPELILSADSWLYKGKPFTGYRVESDRNGKILYQLPIIKGKAEGEAQGWFDTGEKMMLRHFKNGKQEGNFIQWWPNGNIRYCFHYKEGLLNGQQIVNFPDGHHKQESNYLYGNEEGIQRVWNEAGILLSNYTIKNHKIYGIVQVKVCMPIDH